MQNMFGEQKKISSAPSLWTMNTIGWMIYPALGEKPEPYLGSKRGIYYFVVMFLPIFPLASYRVVFNGDGTYSFLSRIPLDKFARLHQAVILLPIVGMILFSALYKPSPEELKRQEAQKVQRIEANTNAAIQRAKTHAQLPTGKYDLKDLVESDEQALEDLAGRIERTRPILEQKEAELKADAAVINQLQAEKNPDKKKLEALIEAAKKKAVELNAMATTFNSTIDLGQQILKERNEAAQIYNAKYARR